MTDPKAPAEGGVVWGDPGGPILLKDDYSMTDERRRPDQPPRAHRTDLARLTTTDDRKDPPIDLDEALNPHRSEEQLRARQHVAELLAHRGVLLAGDETGKELADLWSAVDQFESIVEARGGDTLTNAPDSFQPDNPAFVLPERRAREAAGDYSLRILQAAAALTNFER